MNRRTIVKAIAGLGLAASVSACAGIPMMQKAASQPDIVDTAVAAGSFNTLVAAVGAAGLVDTLKSPGPFTVLSKSSPTT